MTAPVTDERADVEPDRAARVVDRRDGRSDVLEPRRAPPGDRARVPRLGDPSGVKEDRGRIGVEGEGAVEDEVGCKKDGAGREIEREPKEEDRRGVSRAAERGDARRFRAFIARREADDLDGREHEVAGLVDAELVEAFDVAHGAGTQALARYAREPVVADAAAHRRTAGAAGENRAAGEHGGRGERERPRADESRTRPVSGEHPRRPYSKVGPVPTGPLLSVRDLVTTFRSDRSVVRAVDGVSFDIAEGATVGLVGESGCGKSVTSLSILRLVPDPPGRVESGAILFRDRDLLALSEREMRAVRGDQISMIFQEPMTSLNPVYTVGAQIVEAIRLHRKVSRGGAHARAVEMLKLVGIPSADDTSRAYPHELSGGMRQRVMIAMALSCEPKLLVADEPTTALDVTIQAQILELLRKLQSELGMSVLLITHDLGIVAEYTSHVLVMYAGKIVESAPVGDLFARPRHPYTLGLLESVPQPREEVAASEGDTKRKRVRLRAIEGMVPDLGRLPPGCRFQDRCPMVVAECATEEPPLLPLDGGARASRCWRADEVAR